VTRFGAAVVQRSLNAHLRGARWAKRCHPVSPKNARGKIGCISRSSIDCPEPPACGRSGCWFGPSVSSIPLHLAAKALTLIGISAPPPADRTVRASGPAPSRAGS